VKSSVNSIILTILVILWGGPVVAQVTTPHTVHPAPYTVEQDTTGCRDVVHIRGGSVYRGKILSYRPDSLLVLRTWSGAVVHLPGKSVRRVVQKCPESRAESEKASTFEFREAGLYNATRAAVMPGQEHGGNNVFGFSLQHSIGWTVHRLLGVGVGAGVEIYDPGGTDVATYPVFAEVRGYWKPAFFTPFYTFAGGWAFPGRQPRQFDTWGGTGTDDSWQGGWMGKAQLGYRIGNHFTLYGGLSVQRKSHRWTIPWSGEARTERLLNKRLELGLGLLL
jgi:hypothetical protein